MAKLDRVSLSNNNVKCHIRGAFNKFPDFFGMDTFINRTHKKLVPFKVFSSDINALVVPFQQLLESPLEVFLCERV